jgi:hypothetical protein
METHKLEEMQEYRNTIFPLIFNRIKQRSESLVAIGKGHFNQCGLEGWLKVEAVAALANDKMHTVQKISNKGVDLALASGLTLELKGATDFNISGFPAEVAKKGTLLFLQNGNDQEKIKALQTKVTLICHDYFVDSANNRWIMGIVTQKQ